MNRHDLNSCPGKTERDSENFHRSPDQMYHILVRRDRCLRASEYRGIWLYTFVDYPVEWRDEIDVTVADSLQRDNPP